MHQKSRQIEDSSASESLIQLAAHSDLADYCTALLKRVSERTSAHRIELRTSDHATRRVIGERIIHFREDLEYPGKTRLINRKIPPFFEMDIEVPADFEDLEALELMLRDAELALQNIPRPQNDFQNDFQKELSDRQRLDRRIARHLAEVSDTTELAKAIKELVTEIIEVEYTGFYFIDPKNDLLKLGFAHGLEQWEAEDAEKTAWQRHPGLVIRSGMTIDIADTMEDKAELTKTSLRANEIRSRIYMPVRSGDRVIGALGLASSLPDSFTDRHRDIMGFLTDIAGLAWERINQSHKRAVRERMLQATAAISSRLVVSPDWRATISQTMLTLGHVIDVNWGCFLEFDISTSDQSPQVLGQWPDKDCIPTSIELTRANKECLQKGDVVVDEVVPDPDESVIRHTRSIVIACPVMVKGHLKGALVAELDNMTDDQVPTATATLKTIGDAIASCASRCELELALRHSQKLEAVGTLAGGIAHDLNDLIAPILNCAQMLLKTNMAADQHELVRDIRDSAEQAAEIVRQVLDMSRKVEPSRTSNDIAMVLRDAIRLYERTMPPTISLTTDIQDVGLVEIDKSSVHQVILNLCTNACQSMSSGGNIRITLKQAGEGSAALSIRDEGGGMDAYTASHMFDPYFTTKTASGGSGLGLAIVQRILTEIGATADVQSRPYEGTTITITFPTTTDAGNHEEDEPKSTKRIATDYTVFVVDDNPRYRKISANMITHFGYRVESFKSGRDLLKRLDEDDADPAVVVTDLSMPEMDGITITRAIKALDPDLPVICCTGFGSESAMREAARAGVVHFTHKPMDMDDLEEMLRKTIRTGVSRGG